MAGGLLVCPQLACMRTTCLYAHNLLVCPQRQNPRHVAASACNSISNLHPSGQSVWVACDLKRGCLTTKALMKSKIGSVLNMF